MPLSSLRVKWLTRNSQLWPPAALAHNTAVSGEPHAIHVHEPSARSCPFIDPITGYWHLSSVRSSIMSPFWVVGLLGTGTGAPREQSFLFKRMSIRNNHILFQYLWVNNGEQNDWLHQCLFFPFPDLLLFLNLELWICPTYCVKYLLLFSSRCWLAWKKAVCY